jgi:hypothetical protein
MSIVKITDEVHWTLERRPNLTFIWRNAVGGWHDFNETELDAIPIYIFPKDIEINDYLNARRVLEGILDRTLSSGLISPSGDFYGCVDHTHRQLIYYAIGEEDYKKQKGNWLSARAEGWVNNTDTPPTEAQKKTLEKIGRSVDDMEYRNAAVQYDDVFPDGNPSLDALFARYEEIAQAEEKNLQPVKLLPDEIEFFI